MEEIIAPILKEADVPKQNEKEKESVVETEEVELHSTQSDWEQLQEKVEELNVGVARHFEETQDGEEWKPPTVKSP